MIKKSLLLTMLLAIFAPWAANAQTVTIGTGTSAHNSAPIANYYNYSLAEMLFTSAEIGSTDVNTILSIGFEGAAASSKTYVITVYMKNVDATSFSAASDYIQVSASDVVYTGSIKPASGWNTIELATPFTYDNTKSLLVVVNKTSGGYDSNTSIWKYTSMSSPYMMLYGQNDSNPGVYNPTTLTSLATSSERPNVQLTFGTPPTCFAPQNLTCTEYTATSATLTWQRHASGTETAWVLQYSTDNTFATGVQSVNVSTTPSTQLTGLTAETTYFARVRPDCDENLWSDVCEFKPTAAITECEDFEGVTGTSYSTAGSMPEGWYSYTTATGNSIVAPHVCSGSSYNYYHSGSQSLVFESGTNANSNKAYAVMPANASGEYSSLSFYTKNESTSHGVLEVGYVTAQTETACNNFVSLESIIPSTTLHQETIDITSVPSDAFIAFKWQVTTASYYACGIDDVCLSIIPTTTPKPRNLQVSNITSSQATISWEAPASATPTDYEFQLKKSSASWPDSWTSSQGGLAVDLTGISASTDYDVRVRAVYAEGKSDPIETGFRTLDACAFPTNFTATTTPGVGTEADFSWVKGYDETAWVLQIATDANFTTNVDAFTTGFVVDGNNVTYHATGLTPEQTYYAHVKADCSGSTSTYSDVATFTPSNYADFTYGANASTTNSNIPFYGYYANDARTISQYIIPATELLDVAGGTIRSLTYYTSSTPNWGTATVKMYVKEVDYTTFAASSAEAVEDWETMTQVYNGSLTVSNGQMTITFDDTYLYGGGNLMIGIKMDQTGTSASVNWAAVSGSSSNYNGIYGYYYSSWGMSYYRSYNYPKTTINYQPTPYKYPVIDEANCTFGTTTAHIAWTVTGATPTGYQYQYKLASATEWPTTWTSATTAFAYLSDLTSGSSYDFRVKALYDGGNESVVVDYSFFTECAVITAFPWSEKFEAYSAGNFSNPCWVNEHISGNGTNVFKVYETDMGGNSTKKLQLPDQSSGTLTKLRSPEMTLATGTSYQFVIDVFRNASGTSYTSEGVRVFASANGEIEGATELGFLYRNYQQTDGGVVNAENSTGWYTYEFPIPTTMTTCYIILRGENQYGSATYMDNLIVEEIPTCARPEELAYSDVTNHSATISWTAGDAEQTLWNIAYSKTNFDPNTANFDVTTVSTVDATANPFTLDKILDAASTYYVYVRANCGTAAEPDYGPWSRKGISFTTLPATPAPYSFTASNLASTKVDLKWVEGGGDFETSWDLYYVKSETAPEAPTAETPATVTVNTMPTLEAPYELTNLDPESTYYIWIRANHGSDGYSEWVALEGGSFTTLAACPTPTDLASDYITSVSAYISWTGSDDVTEGYTVEYGEEGSYSFNETEDFSAYTATTYSATGSLPEGWYGYSSGSYKPHVSNNSVLGGSYDLEGFAGGSNSTNNFLYMIGNSTSPNTSYTILPQFSDVTAISFDYGMESETNGTLTVGYCTDNTSSSTFVAFTDLTLAKSKNSVSVNLTSADIALLNDNQGYLTFCWTYNGSYGVGIDNVTIKGGTYTPGVTQTVTSDDQFVTLTNLTPGKTYITKVKSNCTSGEYCEPISFTTLAEGNMVFTNATNDGKWGTAGNWAPAQMPISTDEVILRANATIESGCVAEANKINLNSNTLTIADGGQLVTETAVTATVQKVINAHGATVEEGGWNFIALPIYNSNLNPTSAGLITDNLGSNVTPTTATYDLYKFNQNPTIVEGIGNEWINYRKAAFNLANGNGYLYANAATVTLNFTGNIRAYTQEGVGFGLIYSDGNPDANMHGWNLMGNPYTFNAYVNKSYYKMNENGSAIEPVDAYQTTTIAPCTGIMVQATEANQSITFSKDAPSAQNGKGNLSVALAQANVRNNTVMDKAVLSFNEGSQLGKFYFGENAANIYFPQDNKEFAIVSSEGQGEMPLSFRANENGTYTLSFNAEEVSFNYLHLIDNMTGADVDLLAATSTGSVATYTFDARTTDYSSRFKLVFATGSNNDSDNFAFYSNGTWVIGNEGEATLQVIDVTGRVLSSETVNGSVSKAINASAGVYMLRLINGNDVKTQKIVVR